MATLLALIAFLEKEEANCIDLINEIEEGRAKFWSLNTDGNQVETTEKDLIETRRKLAEIQPVIESLKDRASNNK
ncbi:hypothetical protein SIAM614_12893 [Stappia aggregata IAM 12614]|uniref:Uncharacterized protein n=1 Tax=Roseibium aggregatum (strain ATCC 25650 / DSM 13394 / JCM 20685 / NBRC 16684 / NCIMB 2208 / IAM 12614 / B1) TaxID=384765 RepID=A0NQ54_ROSAI|nr:hypothetical protein [Roseibium aggregatum]EAV44912.1 hypothetical protein SIAM614_12893 [Stappia aggregata IAM 12614] [Roseibium aggregatum IAM 12614]